MTTERKSTPQNRARVAHGLGAAVGTFLVATVALSIGVYITGGETASHPGVAFDELSFFDVTSQAAFDVASMVIQMVVGTAGIVTATAAAILSVAFGALGLAGALVVGLGVVTGPVLLIAALVVLVRRHFFPEVI